MDAVMYIHYIFVTVFGITLGSLFHKEHKNTPLNNVYIIGWWIVSTFGFIYTSITPLFYFMNMITIGWLLHAIL
jgi:hypothetical protein